MVAGKEARREGEAKNSWLTGTAAWNFVALSQYICGLRPQHQGLEIEPRLPKHIKNAEFTRKFRDVTYHITVENKLNTGKVTLEVKGGTSNGLVVKADAGVREVFVKAIVE